MMLTNKSWTLKTNLELDFDENDYLRVVYSLRYSQSNISM